MHAARRTLDFLYRMSGGLAALFICLIFLTVILQVGLNIANNLVHAVSGLSPGLLLPSYSDFAGFFLAAASFLALAHTFRNDGHIRVTLVLGRLAPGLRRVAEIFCLSVAAAIAFALSWYAVELVATSLRYGDYSYGLVAIPLWVPQTSLVAGSVVLFICLSDCLVTTLFGAPFGRAASDTTRTG